MRNLNTHIVNLFKKIKNHLLIIILGITLTIIFTWPFVTKLTTFYIDSGDYAFNSSMLWYNQNAIKTGKIFNQEEYFNGYQYYPQSYTIAYSDHLFIPSLIFSPIYWLTNHFVFSVNLLLFISFILSFLASYCFIDYFTKNKFASIIGAIIYSFNPIIFAHFPTHLNLLSHYFLPLFFLCLYKFLSKPTFKNSFIFGLFFALNGLTAVYFQLLSIVILPVFAGPFLVFNLVKKNVNYFIKILQSSFILFLFLPILLYFNSTYLQFSKNEIAVRRLEETFFFSGRLINWFFTNPDNLVYGNFVKRFEKIRSPGHDVDGKFNYAEHTLSLNILPFILLLIGSVYLYEKSKKKKLQNLSSLALTAFILVLFSAFILSLGPYFFGWNGKGPYWKLPFYYLYESFSLFKGMRVPNRIQLIFYIPFVLFASYGATYLFNRIKNKFLFVCFFILLFIFLFAENYNFRSYDQVSNTLRNMSQKILIFGFTQGKTILHIPIHIPELGETSTYTLNWNILTGNKSLNGYSGYVPAEQLSFLKKMKQKLDEEALRDLYAINTDYILIHKDLLNKEELEDYTRFSKLYEKGEIYDENNIIIIDLKKYNFKFNKCNFDKDFAKEFRPGVLKKSSQTTLILVLKNNSNCYLPSIYTDKYNVENFNISNLYGNQVAKTAYYKLPVLIEPYQSVILSEYNNDLRIE